MSEVNNFGRQVTCGAECDDHDRVELDVGTVGERAGRKIPVAVDSPHVDGWHRVDPALICPGERELPVP